MTTIAILNMNSMLLLIFAELMELINSAEFNATHRT